MSRLTKNTREQMARKLVAHRYTDEAKAIVADGKALFERLYAVCYPKPVLDAMAVLDKQFPNQMTRDNYIEVNAGGFSVTVSGKFYSNWVNVPQEKSEGKLLFGRRHNLTDEALIKEVQDYSQRKLNFNDVCRTAYNEALSVLNSMTTGKKLAAAWPEAMAVIGDLIPEDQRTLPVVQVSAINAKFKLPPEETRV